MMPNERTWMLLAKKNAGEASDAELTELAQLLAGNTSSGFTYDILDKVWNSPMTNIPDAVINDDVWQRIEQRTTGSRRFSFIPVTFSGKWAAAASILVFLTAALYFIYFFPANDFSSSFAGQTNLNQVATQPGSKSKLELPDGTLVWLNGSSTLTYGGSSFGKGNREVTLSGEAFFDVTKNELIPFIIHTGNINITVKGTAFNVKAYPEEKTIETSLVRGLIEITTRQDPERRIMLKPNEKIIIPVIQSKIDSRGMEPSDSTETALYSIKKWKSTADAAAPEIAWINNQLIFDDEPFSSIAPKMESWFHIRIRFLDERLKKKRFSGVIEKESVREMLEAMQLSGKFSYEIRENELILGKD